jgi:hypothetical protein
MLCVAAGRSDAGEAVKQGLACAEQVVSLTHDNWG